MFATFKYNETTKDHEYISRSDHPSSADDKEYTRTACDLCRARKLKCKGNDEGCDRCLAASSACTYTFSSGVGAGKKRLRKVTTNSFKTARHSQKSSTETTPRSARKSPTRSTVHDDRPRSGGVASVEERDKTEHTGFSTSPAPWSTIDMDLDSMFSVPSDGSDFLVEEAFTMCPGKIVSRAPQSTVTTTTAAAKQTPAVDTSLLDLWELGHSPDDWTLALQRNRPEAGGTPPSGDPMSRGTTAPPSTAPSTAPSAAGSTAPSTAPSTTPSISPASASPTSAPARHDAMASISGGAIPESCGCLFSMLQTLEDLGVQSAAGATLTPTESLFLCLEQGMDKCRMMLSCRCCDTRASSPMLVTTIVNHLAVVVSELVNRFITCQSPLTVPTVFQFGQFCVEDPTLRSRLLGSMIELYVRDLHKVIVCLQACLAGKQGSTLDDAKARLEKICQILREYGSPDLTVV